jgi:glycosyltransferase involved in cell wall biosynthesis
LKLSILILTHNRPKLFERCIRSVIDNCPNDIEIIVNNDSNDIKEIKNNNIIYYYNKFQLTDIYKFLVQKAQGDFVYFLEDDDYLSPNFYNKIKDELKSENDLIIGKYYSCDKSKEINDNLLRIQHIKKRFNIEDEMFQLGQVIFKRDIFKDFKWFSDNNIHNDYKMTKYFLKKYKYIELNKIFYIQTDDGKDNISFSEYQSN